jgi:predicted  nucleic acid-binding Zn-ribbon protein
MARENQGLQIGLIIFVMLTVVLGATTFWMYKQYDEANAKMKTANEQMQAKAAALQSAESDLAELKRLIGAADTAKVAGPDGMTAQYDVDMTTYCGPTYADKNKGYRKATEYLATQLKNRNGELADAKGEIENWKRKYEAREAAKEPQVKQFAAEAKKAQEDLVTERDKFKTDAEKLTKDQSDLAAQLQTARKEGDDAVTKVESKVKQAGTIVAGMSSQIKKMNDEMLRLRKETFDVPDGKIVWVNPKNRIVWINLGQADALLRQVNFSVYEGRTTDMNKAARKGAVEVTQILGDHLAEARILEDSITDPILRGDVINTLIWSPGEKRHFALAGFMDVDGDGKSDQQLVRNLIAMNGGVIDAEIDDKTGKIVGQITPGTRYLVQGDAPEGKGLNPEFLKSYSKMSGDAKSLGVAPVKLKDVLAQMGWKNMTKMPVNMAEAPPPASTKLNKPDEFRPRQPNRRTSTY